MSLSMWSPQINHDLFKSRNDISIPSAVSKMTSGENVRVVDTQ